MGTPVKVLCTDDDAAVRRTVVNVLRSKYNVIEAADGDAALAQLALHPDMAAIISDMRMPGMDGITLLSHASSQFPDVVRLLLTGQAQLQTAIDAVNQGHIFRFLTKPVSVVDLRTTVDAAVHQHRLITAERVLLEETLHGSISALTDILALASPLAFGRATRLRDLVVALNDALGLPPSWQVEVAAMLSQLPMITLPQGAMERVAFGRDLADDEAMMIERLPIVTDQLLGHIPRLEIVREILKASHAPAHPSHARTPVDPVAQGAALLRLALAYDLLYMQGKDSATAVALLHGRTGVYDADMLAALSRISGELLTSQDLRELPLAEVKAGMVLLDNLILATGMLLVCGGATVTVGLLERLRNLPRGSVQEPIRVNVSCKRVQSAAGHSTAGDPVPLQRELR